MKKSKKIKGWVWALILTGVCGFLAIVFLILSFLPLQPCGDGATCTSPGIVKHYRNLFGVCFADKNGTESIDHNTYENAKGHQMVFVAAKAPSNTQDGNTAHYHCTRCGNNFEDELGLKELSQVVIPANNTRGLEYELIDNRLCSVKIIDNAPSEIKIDAKYEQDNIEYTVTTIKEGSGNRDKLTKIELPNTIEEIEANAFKGFKNLERITFGDESKLFFIGESAFENCKSLTSITIPDSVVSIGDNAFYGCDSLISVTIGDRVTSIGIHAFEKASNIKTARLPALAISYIAKANLQTVVITSGESISEGAFENCSSLVSITIPDSVTSIGYKAFYNCRSLESIAVPDRVTSISQFAFYGCSSLESVSIEMGSQLTSIEDCAFENCSSLVSITIPDSVTSIGYKAFYNCRSLESIAVPDGVTWISQFAFYGCSSLKSITIPYVGAGGVNVKYTHFGFIFGASYYSDNSEYIPASLKEVIIIGGTSIGDYAFYGCSLLKSITIPGSVTSIGDLAFSECSSLESITIPNGVTSIGAESFFGCRSLESVSFGNESKLTSIGNGAFYGCRLLKSITIPNGVTTIEDSEFSYCRGLISITIPDGVTSIEEGAFICCESLESITIPSNVTSIGVLAFDDCSSLKEITIPSSVTSIGAESFGGCSSLQSVYYGGTIADWCKISFDDCYATPMGRANDCHFYIKQNGNWQEVTEIVISESLTKIGNYQFSGFNNVTSITILCTVTSIGERAFYCCLSLTEITIPSGVTSIGDGAFFGCPIEHATIPIIALGIPQSCLKTLVINGGTSIGDWAFDQCSSLKEITIPSSVTSIGSGAFFGCSSLQSVYYGGTIADWCKISFDDRYATPMGRANDCHFYIKQNGNWQEVTEIVISESLTKIGNYQFSGFENVTSITISCSVTSIGERAFYCCNNLQTATFEDDSQLKSIGEGAFEGCARLKNITIPENTTSIEFGAFSGCSNLTNMTVPFVGLSECSNVFTHFGYIFGADNYLYNVLYVPASLKKVTITGGTLIGDYAFYGCANLESVTMGEGIISIGERAFWGCSRLMNINIPESVTSIGSWAFCDCSAMTSIEIPDGVTSIGNNAFKDCDSLTIYIVGGASVGEKSGWDRDWNPDNRPVMWVIVD